MQDMQPDNSAMPTDNEGAMAKADLYKLANYSFKLFKQIDGNAQLEGWVQAKITKAADYIASVYHYMEYEMKFSEYGEQLENSDMYSESERAVLKGKLMEAKDKMKELKKKQADKVGKKDMPVKEEKSSTGGEIDRSKKGVTKHKENPNRFSDEPHTEPKSNAKSQSAADKAGDKAADKAEEKEGKAYEKAHGKGSVTRVKDGKKVDEGTTEVQTDKDGKRTGVKHTSTHKYSDEPHTEPKSQAKSRSAADKAGDKAADKAAEKDSKAYEKKNPGTVSRYKDGKKVNEASKVVKDKKVKEDPNEGNEFSGELVKAKASGAKEFKVDGKTFPVKEAAKWRDAKHKDKLYTQEPRDYDQYDYHDDDYYNGPKPDDYPGEKNLKGGGEFDHNDPLVKGYGRGGRGSPVEKGPRKGLPSRNHITSLKGSIKSAHGTHPRPNLPEAASDKKPCPPMSHVKKMCQDGKSVAEICKMHSGCDQKELKQMVADCKKKMDEGKGDGNLANNAKPYDKVTRGDVIAGRLGKDEKGGKKVKDAITKAKAKMEGSIQGGVWVSSPDKGVAPPQDIDGGSAPAPKKAKSPFPSRNKPATTPAPATKPQSVMPSRNKAPEVVKENVDLDRLKTLTKYLLG